MHSSNDENSQIQSKSGGRHPLLPWLFAMILALAFAGILLGAPNHASARHQPDAHAPSAAAPAAAVRS